jgi:hypothetical protein
MLPLVAGPAKSEPGRASTRLFGARRAQGRWVELRYGQARSSRPTKVCKDLAVCGVFGRFTHPPTKVRDVTPFLFKKDWGLGSWPVAGPVKSKTGQASTPPFKLGPSRWIYLELRHWFSGRGRPRVRWAELRNLAHLLAVLKYVFSCSCPTPPPPGGPEGGSGLPFSFRSRGSGPDPGVNLILFLFKP